MTKNKLSMMPSILGVALGAVAGYSVGVLMSDSGARQTLQTVARRVQKTGNRELGKYTQAIAHQVEKGKQKSGLKTKKRSRK